MCWEEHHTKWNLMHNAPDWSGSVLQWSGSSKLQGGMYTISHYWGRKERNVGQKWSRKEIWWAKKVKWISEKMIFVVNILRSYLNWARKLSRSMEHYSPLQNWIERIEPPLIACFRLLFERSQAANSPLSSILKNNKVTKYWDLKRRDLFLFFACNWQFWSNQVVKIFK